jgi:hypothetical protein
VIARDAGERDLVEDVGVFLHAVEERAERCLRDPRGEVGDALDERSELELAREVLADLVDQLELLGFRAQLGFRGTPRVV